MASTLTRCIATALFGLLVLAFVVLYVIGTVQWNRLHGKHEVPVETISIPTDQASIARGEHIVTIRLCNGCHTENLSGHFGSVPGLFTLSFPNLTPGAGGSHARTRRRFPHCDRLLPRTQCCVSVRVRAQLFEPLEVRRTKIR